MSGESLSFEREVEDFNSVFGCDGLKCLIIFCIQENKELDLGEDKLKNKLYNSNGYKRK